MAPDFGVWMIRTRSVYGVEIGLGSPRSIDEVKDGWLCPSQQTPTPESGAVLTPVPVKITIHIHGYEERRDGARCRHSVWQRTR